jgi:hypothetical protein
MKMSEEAREVMRRLAEQYAATGFANHNVWSFSPDKDDPAFRELLAFKLIMRMGGRKFRLTDLGQKWVMANRPGSLPLDLKQANK